MKYEVIKNRMTVKKAKEIREQLDLRCIVLFGIDDDLGQHVISHGKDKINAVFAAEYANDLKEHLKWPKELCNAKPLKRICENCDYYRRNKVEPGDRIPSNWSGKCFLNPEAALRKEQDRACKYFEPNS